MAGWGGLGRNRWRRGSVPLRVPQKPGVWQGGHGEGKSRATSLVGSPQPSLFLSQGKAGLSSGGSNHMASVTPLAKEPAG